MQRFWVHIARFCLPLFLACLSLAFTVTPGQAEQVQLAWDAPAQSDGTPFPTLAGYKLYSGSRSGQYQTTVSVGEAPTYTVTNLSPGQTYYFAVTAHDISGEESSFSNEISVTIPGTPQAGALIPQQQLRVVSVDSEDTTNGRTNVAVKALDGSSATIWHTEWQGYAPQHPHTLVLDLGGLYQVDGFKYLPPQYGNPNGTIAAYEFYVSPDGLTWSTPAVAGTLAANITEKTVRFPAKPGRFVRLVALSEINGKPYTSAAEMNIFGVALATLDTDTDGLSDAQEVLLGTDPLRADTDGDGLTDGAEVTTHRTNPLLADTDGDGRSDGDESRDGSNPLVKNTTVPGTLPAGAIIPQQQLRVVSVDSEDTTNGRTNVAVKVLDGRSTTMWHTEWQGYAPQHPHTLVLDLGGLYQVDGFKYLPPQYGNPNGTIAAYEFYVSPDGLTWSTPAVAGTLAANITEKTVRFPAKPGRFVRLVALSEINGKPYTSAAEMNIFGVALAALSNAQGVLLDTNSLRADTDGGGFTDGAEVTTHRTNPLLANTDGDGRSDGDESRGGSNPPVKNTTASQHTRWEVELTSTHTYTNPFADVTVSVEYRKSGTPPIQGYAFWDGGSTFKLRQAFPTPGTWYYKTTATNQADSGLHNREGIVDVLPYTGTNPLYRHGFLQVSSNQRFLEHADGTPFLWLGDTLWGATVWLTEAGFKSAVADRRAKHFTVLQTNIAHKAEVDTNGDTPWAGDRWNVRFMQKLDRMFDNANDQGMYLFVNGLADLLQDRGIPQYERLVEMIAIRYAAHFVSFASSMDDPYDVLHERINAAIQRVAPYHLVTQHPGSGPKGQSNVRTAEQYYDTSLVDYVMHQTGVEGDLEAACRNAIEWSQRLYRHAPHKPVINGQTWYEGLHGGTAEIATQLGYISLLSGNAGYTYGTSLWNARDADVPAWKAFRGATYMQYLYEFFMNLDGGRPLQPRHGLIKNQLTRYQDRMALGVSADGMTYAAFLPKGGTITVDLAALVGSVGVTWYDPLTGQYRDLGVTPGGAVRSFASPFGTSQSALVLMVQ